MRESVATNTEVPDLNQATTLRAGMKSAIGPCSTWVPSPSIPATAAGVIQEFNRRAVELWGRAPVLGDTDERFCGSFKLYRPDGTFMPHEQCPMAEVVAGTLSEACDAEVIIERPDGSRITVVVNIRPVTNELGGVIGAINCFYDITSRKQTEEALRARERPNWSW